VGEDKQRESITRQSWDSNNPNRPISDSSVDVKRLSSEESYTTQRQHYDAPLIKVSVVNMINVK
jgi:hypothetical protein